ncbi:MAG: hypothetical protein AAB672_00535 [Patescibacteria group bacterium]
MKAIRFFLALMAGFGLLLALLRLCYYIPEHRGTPESFVAILVVFMATVIAMIGCFVLALWWHRVDWPPH